MQRLHSVRLALIVTHIIPNCSSKDSRLLTSKRKAFFSFLKIEERLETVRDPLKIDVSWRLKSYLYRIELAHSFSSWKFWFIGQRHSRRRRKTKWCAKMAYNIPEPSYKFNNARYIYTRRGRWQDQIFQKNTAAAAAAARVVCVFIKERDGGMWWSSELT